MVPSHTVHLPLGALLIMCTMCGTGMLTDRYEAQGGTSAGGIAPVGHPEFNGGAYLQEPVRARTTPVALVSHAVHLPL